MLSLCDSENKQVFCIELKLIINNVYKLLQFTMQCAIVMVNRSSIWVTFNSRIMIYKNLL